MEEAYSTRGSGALAKVAQMGAEQLNAVGDHAGALARLNQALQMAGADRGAQAQILAARAGWEVFSEQPSVAQLTLAQAAEVLPPDADAETVIGVDAVSATVALVLLQPGAIDSATDAISRARSNEFDSMASGLMVFLIAALGSSEDAPQAAAWADALHGYAASLPHPAREVDAAVAQVALRGRRIWRLLRLSWTRPRIARSTITLPGACGRPGCTPRSRLTTRSVRPNRQQHSAPCGRRSTRAMRLQLTASLPLFRRSLAPEPSPTSEHRGRNQRCS